MDEIYAGPIERAMEIIKEPKMLKVGKFSDKSDNGQKTII